MSDYDWILGLGIAIFIPTIMTILVSIKDGHLEVNGKVFIIFLPIGFAFSTYSGLLNPAYFIFSFILSFVIIIIEVIQFNKGS